MTGAQSTIFMGPSLALTLGKIRVFQDIRRGYYKNISINWFNQDLSGTDKVQVTILGQLFING